MVGFYEPIKKMEFDMGGNLWAVHPYKGLYYLEGDGLLGEDGEDTVDSSHPTDLGFLRMADAFEPVLREMLSSQAGG